MGTCHSRSRLCNYFDGNNTPDTVTLARQEREKQGTWEAEVSYGGEADLHRHLKECNKNPGHLKFIPVDQFNVDHLPSCYHDNDLVDLVRAVSDLTVRVSVKHVSERRPKTAPGSDKPYPCYSKRGRNMMRVGTGCISGVRRYTHNIDTDKTCECKECLNSLTPKTKFARIYINTAAHVVYDELEGEHTTCHLFFDRGGTPDVCNGVVTLSGMSDVWSNTETDFSKMQYDTHDLDLADNLHQKLISWKCLYNKIYERYFKEFTVSDLERAGSVADLCKILTIIVSHPHGCSKQVSVGHCINMGQRMDAEYKATYTTATCPGSSGAPVFVLGWRWQENYFCVNYHSGNCEWNRKLNFCGEGFY